MKKRIISLAVIFAAGSCIWANDYTLENCFDAALRSDYSLSIINDEIGKKILERRDALSSYYPVIGAIGNIQYKSEVPTLDLSLLGMGGGTAELGTSLTYDFSIYMNQIIFDGLSRKYTRLLSENGLNRELQKKTLREDVINQTILQLSYSYTLSTLNIETLTTSMKRLGFNLNQVKLFVDQGFSSELDLLDIQSKLKELEQEKLSLESNRRKILLQISELTGISDIDTLIIPEEYLELLNPDNLQGIEDKLEANGELSLFDFTRRKIELKKKVDEASFYPHVSGTVGAHYGLPGTNFTGTDWQLYFTGGLLVELNLWEGGRRAALLRRDNLSLNQNAKSRDAYIRALYFDTMRKFDELVSLKDQRPAICRDQASASEEPAGKPSVSDCPGQRHSVQDETHSSL
ncbi:MAG TPA: TolC family protein [Spirochaetales bacterium]|nr:TolC family protein [Spirochaetales bacterium]